MSGSPRWALDGNAILFTTERYGMRAHASWGSQNDAMLVFLNQDAYDKFRLSKEDYELQKELEKEQQKDKAKTLPTVKKTKRKMPKEKTEDEERRGKGHRRGTEKLEDRIVRLTPNSSDMGSAIISKDGETLITLSAFEGGYDLWKMDLRKKDTKLLHKMNAGWASMEMDQDGKTLFLLGRQHHAENGYCIRRAEADQLSSRGENGFGGGTRIYVQPRVQTAEEAFLQHRTCTE